MFPIATDFTPGSAATPSRNLVLHRNYLYLLRIRGIRQRYLYRSQVVGLKIEVHMQQPV